MMRSLVLLLAFTASAAAQPAWSESKGWGISVSHDFDARTRDIHRDFEETSRRIHDDFDRTRNHTFLAFGAFAVAAIIISAISAASRKRRRLEWTAPIVYAPVQAFVASASGNVDVSVLRIAIDGRASKFVQTELDRLVKQSETTSAEGRAKLLREVSLTLRRVRDAWIFGGAVNEPLRVLGDATAVFARHVDDARSRFKNAAAPPIAQSMRDARSLILVSIILAARGELATVTDIGAGDDLRRALETAAHRDPADLVALEVIWAPVEAERTISSIELEGAYPRPEVLPLQGALAGTTFCTYCGGPFPAELVSCPHCGAPAHAKPRAVS